MTYQFDVEVASEVGVEEAIMIQNLAFWIAKNRANEQALKDGRVWTYNSTRAFSRLFPFWTEKQIRRILDSLEKKGVIVVGNYNRSPMDKTRWFAFTDEWDYLTAPFAQTGKSICPNGSPNGQMELPKQANLYTDNKPDEEKKRKRFTPPSLPEIEARCREIELPVSEAQKFYSYYSSKGWKVGRSPMVCWKAALNTWKLNREERMPKKVNGHNGHDPEGWMEFLNAHPEHKSELNRSTMGTKYRFAPERIKLEFMRARKKARA